MAGMDICRNPYFIGINSAIHDGQITYFMWD